MKLSSECTTLKKSCLKRARAIYGYKLPARIEKRIDEELAMIEKLGLAPQFLATSQLLKHPKWNNYRRYLRGFRGMLGASFIAYLSGITPYNPMELPKDCTLYPELLFNESYIDKPFYMYLNFGTETAHDIKSSNHIPSQIEIFNSPNLTLLEKLQKETGEVYTVGGNEPPLHNDIAKLSDFFLNNLYYPGKVEQGQKNLDYLPIINSKFYALMILDEYISAYKQGIISSFKIRDLAKLIEYLHGSGIWYDNAEKLIRSGSHHNITNCITSVEDIYELLTFYNVGNKERRIALCNKIRCGQPLSEPEINLLRARCISEETIRMLGKIKYVFSRAQSICYALETKRLIYYYNKHRDLYIDTFNSLCGTET